MAAREAEMRAARNLYVLLRDDERQWRQWVLGEFPTESIG